MSKKKTILEEIPKKDAFKAPEGFFDAFYDELEQVIDTKEEKPKTKEIPLRSRNGWVLIAASVSLVLTTLAIFWMNQNEEVFATDVLSTVSSEEITFYLEDSALDTETLLEEIDLSLLAMDQHELMELEDLSEEDMNMIREQYEDLF